MYTSIYIYSPLSSFTEIYLDIHTVPGIVAASAVMGDWTDMDFKFYFGKTTPETN